MAQVPTSFSSLSTHRPDLATPSAYCWHHRFGCASEGMLTATQRATEGMTIRKDTLPSLKHLPPCEACIAGKLRKAENPTHPNFAPLTNNVLQTPSTTNKFPYPSPQNLHCAADFAIVVNNPHRKGNTCFMLLVDLGIDLVHVKPLPS